MLNRFHAAKKTNHKGTGKTQRSQRQINNVIPAKAGIHYF